MPAQVAALSSATRDREVNCMVSGLPPSRRARPRFAGPALESIVNSTFVPSNLRPTSWRARDRAPVKLYFFHAFY